MTSNLSFTEPMMALPVRDLPTGHWLYEMKFDGYRALAFKSGKDVRTLVSGIEDYAVFLLSPEGNIISWNDGAQRIKGFMPEEIIGKHPSVFYTPEALQRDLPRHILRSAAKEGQCADEGWRVRKD